MEMVFSTADTLANGRSCTIWAVLSLEGFSDENTVPSSTFTMPDAKRFFPKSWLEYLQSFFIDTFLGGWVLRDDSSRLLWNPIKASEYVDEDEENRNSGIALNLSPS